MASKSMVVTICSLELARRFDANPAITGSWGFKGTANMLLAVFRVIPAM